MAALGRRLEESLLQYSTTLCRPHSAINLTTIKTLLHQLALLALFQKEPEKRCEAAIKQLIMLSELVSFTRAGPSESFPPTLEMKRREDSARFCCLR